MYFERNSCIYCTVVCFLKGFELVFDDQYDNENDNRNYQTGNAFHGAGILLRLFGLFELRDSRLGALNDRLHVVIDPFQDSPLVDDQHRQLVVPTSDQIAGGYIPPTTGSLL